MKEGCAVKIEGKGYGIVMSTEQNALFKGRIGIPCAAVCPECGEISLYIDNINKLKNE